MELILAKGDTGNPKADDVRSQYGNDRALYRQLNHNKMRLLSRNGNGVSCVLHFPAPIPVYRFSSGRSMFSSGSKQSGDPGRDRRKLGDSAKKIRQTT